MLINYLIEALNRAVNRVKDLMSNEMYESLQSLFPDVEEMNMYGVQNKRKARSRRMSELKKCPFCGNTNVFVGTDWELEGRDESDGTGLYAVVCNYLNGGCGACGGYRKTKNAAIAAWNKRESEVEEG